MIVANFIKYDSFIEFNFLRLQHPTFDLILDIPIKYFNNDLKMIKYRAGITTKKISYQKFLKKYIPYYIQIV
jgi:hypothetical protein